MNCFLFAIIGVAVGSVITWLFLHEKIKSAADLASANSSKDLAVTQEKLIAREQELISIQKQLTETNEILSKQNKAVEDFNIQKATSEERLLKIPVLEKELAELKQSLSKESELRSTVSNQLAEVSTQANERGKRLEELKNELNALKEKNQDLEQQISVKKISLADMEARVTEERKQMGEKLGLLSEAKEQMKSDFQNLANQILEEKTQKFTEQNKEKLDGILMPLREQLGEFKKKVEDVYVNESKDREALSEHIKILTALNQQVSKDTDNLTRALKGESKTQGNWGEMILERALELSGLKKGSEYDTQVSITDEEGKRQQPDVIVHLPEGRDIVVDSKVSLTAYESAVSAADDQLREESVAAHLGSVRNHIEQLSGKAYDKLLNIKSLDYVLMFMPIEAAFVAAISKDPGLFEYAYRKKIILVSPSTLMVTLRTIQNLWHSEYQNRNTQEIVRKAADLYDKFAGFVDILEEVKKAIGTASLKCENAVNHLSVGRGNIVGRIEAFKRMGVNPKKALPLQMVESVILDEGEAGDNSVDENQSKAEQRL